MFFSLYEFSICTRIFHANSKARDFRAFRNNYYDSFVKFRTNRRRDRPLERRTSTDLVARRFLTETPEREGDARWEKNGVEMGRGWGDHCPFTFG